MYSSIETVAEDSSIRPQLPAFRSDVYYVIIYSSRPSARLFSLFYSYSSATVFDSYFIPTPLPVTPFVLVLLPASQLPCT